MNEQKSVKGMLTGIDPNKYDWRREIDWTAVVMLGITTVMVLGVAFTVLVGVIWTH